VKRSAFLFPGLGSQQIGMLERVPDYARIVQYLDAAEAITGVPLGEISRTGPAEALDDPLIAAPLVYLTGFAWADALRRYGVKADYVAGYSAGEISALAFADVISVGAGLQLAVARARCIADAVRDSDGGMFAVTGLVVAQVSEVIASEPNLWIAFDNAPDHQVVSGARTSLEAVTPLLYAAGATRVIPLTGEGALHSPWLVGASEHLSDLLEQAEFRDASVPVLPNATAQPTRDGEEIRQSLIDQMTATVRWRETAEFLAGQNLDFLIESGPGTVLPLLGGDDAGPARVPLAQTGIEATAARVFRRTAS